MSCGSGVCPLPIAQTGSYAIVKFLLSLNPSITLLGSSSIAREIECLIECKKQK